MLVDLTREEIRALKLAVGNVDESELDDDDRDDVEGFWNDLATAEKKLGEAVEPAAGPTIQVYKFPRTDRGPLALVALGELRALVETVEHFVDRHFGTTNSPCELRLRNALRPFAGVSEPAGRRPSPDA